jgi:hypothetical protein
MLKVSRHNTTQTESIKALRLPHWKYKDVTSTLSISEIYWVSSSFDMCWPTRKDMYCDAIMLGQCRSSLMKTMSRCFGKYIVKCRCLQWNSIKFEEKINWYNSLCFHGTFLLITLHLGEISSRKSSAIRKSTKMHATWTILRWSTKEM